MLRLKVPKRCLLGGKGKMLYSMSSPPSSWKLDLFSVVPSLKSKTEDPHKPHFIFLEGLSGCGKQEILKRLSNMDFTVDMDTYSHFVNHNSKYSHLPAHGHAISCLWGAQRIEKLKHYTEQHSNGKKFQSNTIFLHRSPLSIDAHQNITHPFAPLMQELKKEFNISLIYCWSDPIRRQERLAERQYWADKDYLEFWSRFFPEDPAKDQQISSNYQSLQSASHFEADLPTTSTKQATAQLLRMCDIGVQLPPLSQS
eukprot:TRINITY_DN9565_c0_g1_i2.p1 TRINITY_DN9565_c0_g1~~TRINITY_DN9565_c0_g1_i2.p1  ORF type:complete len:255 (-),score=45.77 TRINITY_DN9565_c0_g1_i2:44-808(-)